jgi:uncharacterized iron-regulated membrane protein
MSSLPPSPTRFRGRNLWFQLHKWIGLLLFLAFIPVSASGSLLVWHDWLDEVVNPQRYAVSDSRAVLPTAPYLDAARAVLKPGDRLGAIEFPAEAGHPVTVTAFPEPNAKPAAGPPPRYQVWLDPADARVVDHADARAGLVRFLHVFHGSLMWPGWGRTIVGWLGVAMLISALTGLWLWLPTTARWLRGLRWNRGPLISGNLHHQVGIWIAIPLAILSFTGAYISFPSFFRSIEQSIASAPQKPSGPSPNRRARPVASTMLTADQAIAAARLAAPGDVATVRWPTETSGHWTVALSNGDTRTEVEVGDADGSASAKPSPPAGAARFMRQLHDGNGYNIVWQVIIFVGGLAPAVLGVTGVIMWLRTRAWRKRAAIRRTAATA